MPKQQKLRILVPTDFTPHSIEALHFAATHTPATMREIHLLHTIHEEASTPGYYRTKAHAADDRPFDAIAQDMMHTFLNTAIKQYPTLSPLIKSNTLHITFLDGQPSARILEYSALKNINMIVMGTHNRRGPKGWFIPSHTREVLQKTTIPVTVVKAQGA